MIVPIEYAKVIDLLKCNGCGLSRFRDFVEWQYWQRDKINNPFITFVTRNVTGDNPQHFCVNCAQSPMSRKQ